MTTKERLSLIGIAVPLRSSRTVPGICLAHAYVYVHTCVYVHAYERARGTRLCAATGICHIGEGLGQPPVFKNQMLFSYKCNIFIIFTVERTSRCMPPHSHGCRHVGCDKSFPTVLVRQAVWCSAAWGAGGEGGGGGAGLRTAPLFRTMKMAFVVIGRRK